jgi:hypothetical protein
MGSLYPPDGHPAWGAVTQPQEAYLARRLLVMLDGQRILDAQAHFEPALAGRISLGQAPFLRGYSSMAFSGEILSSKRLPLAAMSAANPKAAYGAVRLALRFPEHPEAQTREPLVTTGVPRAGDIVYVRYLPGGRVSFGIDHWGGAGFATGAVPVDPSVEHVVLISVGSLFPAAGHGERVQHARVEMDGSLLFDGEQDTYDSSPYDVAVGVNPIGGSTCAYAFTGRILGVERLPGGN